MSSYEEIRRKNLEENKKILASLGLLNPFKPLPKVIHKPVKRQQKSEEPPAKRQRVIPTTLTNPEEGGSIYGRTRRSARIKNQPVLELPDEDDSVNEDYEEYKARGRIPPGRPNVFGKIEGVEIGTTYATRLDSCAAGVHRPTVAGIHGGDEGAYSIALSGGYEDDIDMGDCFTYTGQGGRDLKGTKANPKNLRTAAQSKDQQLILGNLALSKNVEHGKSVRVIRGYKLKSPFAPTEGYRYDGLYNVEKYWFTTGMSGYGVYKFALRRCKNQPPPPWTYEGKDSEVDETNNKFETVAEVHNEKDQSDKDDKEKSDEKKITMEDTATSRKIDGDEQKIEIEAEANKTNDNKPEIASDDVTCCRNVSEASGQSSDIAELEDTNSKTEEINENAKSTDDQLDLLEENKEKSSDRKTLRTLSDRDIVEEDMISCRSVSEASGQSSEPADKDDKKSNTCTDENKIAATDDHFDEENKDENNDKNTVHALSDKIIVENIKANSVDLDVVLKDKLNNVDHTSKPGSDFSPKDDKLIAKLNESNTDKENLVESDVVNA